jgi:hypothetical protein
MKPEVSVAHKQFPIRVVMDDLSDRHRSALGLQCLDFHYTSRHASCLNKAEIEIGVVRRQYFDRCIARRKILEQRSGFGN